MKKNEQPEPLNILGFGMVDFELSLKLSKSEESFYKLNIEKLKPSDKAIETILQTEEILKNCWVNIRSFLGNMLVFLNKTSKYQNIIDIICLNTLTVENEKFPMIKKKIFTYLQEDLNSVIDSKLLLSKNINLKLTNDEQVQKMFSFNYFKQEAKPIVEGEKFMNIDQLIDHLGGNEGGHEGGNEEILDPKTEDLKPNTNNNQKSNEILNSIEYNYTNLNYVFIDLSLMLEVSKILDIAEFFNYIKTNLNPNTSLITFFPKLHYINKENAVYIMYFLSISDITVYDVYDLTAFSKLIGIQSDEKNLEVLFLKEVKKIKKKPCKIGIFFDNFYNKLSVLIQESTNLVLYHKDFVYDFKKESEDIVYNTILQNKDYFKSVFFGGFFSKIVKKKSYEVAFEAGCEIVKRMTKLIMIGNYIHLDREYYVVLVPSKRKRKKDNKKDELTKLKESNFVLDCTNFNLSKLKSYNPLYDQHLSTFFSSNVIKKHLKKQKFINKKGFILDDPDSKSIENKVIKEKYNTSEVNKQLNKTPGLLLAYQEEQNKLFSIKDSNERMKLQLNHLFNNSSKINQKDLLYISKLPMLQNIDKLAGKKLPCLDISKNPLADRIKPPKLFMNTTQNFSTKRNLIDPEFIPEEHNSKNIENEDVSNFNPVSKQNFEKFLSLFEQKAHNMVYPYDNKPLPKTSNEKYRSKSNMILFQK